MLGLLPNAWYQGSVAGTRNERFDRPRGGHSAVVVVVALELFMNYLICRLLVPLDPDPPANATSEEKLDCCNIGYMASVLAAAPFVRYVGDHIDYHRIYGLCLRSVVALVFLSSA